MQKRALIVFEVFERKYDLCGRMRQLISILMMTRRAFRQALRVIRGRLELVAFFLETDKFMIFREKMLIS